MPPPPPSDAEILERLTDIVARILDLDDLQLTPATVAADVPGWDSLAHVQIVVAVERAFRIRFRTGEVAGLANLDAFLGRIRERLRAG
jgi:acyl carrier protein